MRRILLALAVSFAAWAQTPGSIRYIVQLEGDPAILSQNRMARATEIHAQHKDFQQRLAGIRDASVVATTATALNAVIIEGATGQLARLASLPGVKRVEISRELKLHLDRALHNHGIPPAWAEAGGWEKAGRGIKIAILDTGIEPERPGFQMPEVPLPDGYPKANSEANLALTNNKIIVARSFDNLSARDMMGHGTAVATVAAANLHDSPRGKITGAAPKAWIGAYRVGRGTSNAIYTDLVLQAIDAAVEDDMNVINMSFGSIGLTGSADDVIAQAARNATNRGIIVTMSAGNSGPEIMTIDDAAADSDVIAVGAAQNSRTITPPRVRPPAGADIVAAPSSNVLGSQPLSGDLVDLATLDASGRACTALPAGSLHGAIPLILRGGCTFSDKLANAARAGAPAAVVYNAADDPSPESLVQMSVDDNPTIPGLFIGSTDGLRLKTAIAASEDGYHVVLQFAEAPNNPNQLANFSSPGPSVDLKIKPDVLATGQTVFTATQTRFPSGRMYNASGFTTTSGTSFSAPLVAGTAASLKSLRPGLHLIQYRSLLINTATPMFAVNGKNLPVMQTGAGNLNLLNAIRSSVSIEPVSLAFSPQNTTVDTWRQIILRNISTEARTYNLSVETSDTVAPQLTQTQVTLAPDQIAGPVLVWSAGGLAAGAYQGFIRIEEPVSGVVSRVPYWMAVKSAEPVSISLPEYPATGLPGTTQVILARVHDAAGLALSEPTPEVTVNSGAGSVLSVDPSGLGPGLWEIAVRLGPGFGANEFTVKAGNVTRTFSISGGF